MNRDDNLKKAYNTSKKYSRFIPNGYYITAVILIIIGINFASRTRGISVVMGILAAVMLICTKRVMKK